MNKKKHIKALSILVLLFLYFNSYSQRNENVRIIEGAAMDDYSLIHNGQYNYMIMNGHRSYGPSIDGVEIYRNYLNKTKQCVVVIKLDSLNRYVSHFVTDTSIDLTLLSGSYKDAICFSAAKWSEDDGLDPVVTYVIDDNLDGKEIFSTHHFVMMNGSFIKNGRMYLTGTFKYNQGTRVISGDSLPPMHKYIPGYGELVAENTIFTIIKDIEQDSFILKNVSGGSYNNEILDVEMNDKGEMMVCGKCQSDTFRINNVAIDAPIKPGLYKSGFVYKLDADGNKIFAKLLYSNSVDYIYRLDYDEEGNTYIGVRSHGRTSMFDDVILSSNDSIGGEQANILKLDEQGNVKWKVKADGGKYLFPRCMEVGDELVYVALQFGFYNEDTTAMIGDIILPKNDKITTYVVGFDKETGEFKNSFGFKGDILIDNLVFVGRDTLLIYGYGPVDNVLEGGTNLKRSVLYHRIGGLTGIHETIKERKGGIVYPNPVSSGSELTIVAPEGLKIEDVSIFNINGELIKNGAIGYKEGTLSLGFISTGIYLIKISTKDYEYIEKVVVGN